MKKLVLALSFILLTCNAAAALNCVGQVTGVLLYKNGVVNVSTSWRQDYVHICNLNTEREGVSVTTCAMWVALLQNVKKNNGSAAFYYEPDARYNSCSNVPTYADSPAPVYIGDV